MGNYPAGSEWRIWDLHIHTPQTAKNDQFGNDNNVWETYISTLEANADIAVLGVTDYFCIDNYLYLKEQQKLGRLTGKTLIPNIELRILPVTQKDIPINIHILFDPALPIDTIEREFLSCIKFQYQGSEYSCLSRDLIALGKAFRNDETINDKCAKKAGIEQFVVNFSDVSRIIRKPTINKYILVAVANSNRDGNSGIQHSSLAATRQEIYRMSNIIFSGNENDIKYFLGKGKDSPDVIIHNYGSIKPCITGSDAHSMDGINIFPNNRRTWIKADPTFEGLKQIIYEPESRVKIQEENPTYDIEKSPFTRIAIPQKVQVFSDDNDIFFAPTELPLNSNLVSIIGGRGTGKSVLINYLAAVFRKNSQFDKYNLETDIMVSRQASINESAKEFKVADSPNVPFMYIAQSQIKDLVQDKSRFSKNILETIGVSKDYSISLDYAQKAEDAINEYFRIIKIINSNNTTAEEKEDYIKKEIKRYSEFIANITSEQNKTRLEGYKNKIGRLHKIQDFKNNLQQFSLSIIQFAQDSNEQIAKWNQQFECWQIDIPPIDVQSQIKYIQDVFLPKVDAESRKTQKEIEDTKNEFKDYKGDLSTLLSNVSGYQNQISELDKQLNIIIQEKIKYNKLTTDLFKNLGNDIRSSIEAYSSLIEKQWRTFKGEDGDKKKELLDIILKEDLDVKVSINFNATRMYELLLDKLDRRSYNEDKLRKLLNIETIDDFYNFISQKTDNNIFNEEIRDDLRGRVLELFFKKYTAFISHNVNVTLNGKPINKLSYGQQGTIYLRLQIAANLYSETIIYDQPEDDLDNSFITSELISIFKKIKQYRQIIIVSHNANLVVNADSEQVIIARNDDGVLSYVAGALEDPDINKAVCQILEGGKNAFEKREQKYSISQ